MIPRLITNNGDATAIADNNLLPIHDNIQAAIISVLPQLFPQRQIIEKDVLYPWQNEALEAILQHQTTMVSMPTGSGKSLVFTVLGPVINAFEKLRALHTNPNIRWSTWCPHKRILWCNELSWTWKLLKTDIYFINLKFFSKAVSITTGCSFRGQYGLTGPSTTFVGHCIAVFHAVTNSKSLRKNKKEVMIYIWINGGLSLNLFRH